MLLQPDAPPAAPPEPSKATEPPAAKPAEEPGTSLVQLQQSRLAWDSLRKRVQTQLKEIEQSILAGVKEHNADEAAEDQFEEAEVGAAIKTLHTILGEHDERLLDKLDEALNAKSEAERRDRHQEAAAIIQEYQSFAGSDATLAKSINPASRPK